MYRKKRGRRRYVYRTRKKTKINFLPVIMILCLSVICGYATAKYVVEPVVNYVPDIADKKVENTDKTETDISSIIEDEVNIKSDREIQGYALQYGCYSSEVLAQKAMSNLEKTGLKSIEQDGMYKIIGEIYNSKEEAKRQLSLQKNDEKVFVTTIYK